MLDGETLQQQLKQFATSKQIKTWWLAYSGGVDSQVLLHLLASTQLAVRAVYVDHGLQAASLDWQTHCAYSCEQLGIPFQSIVVHAQPQRGEGPEAAARIARYAALAKLINKHDCLLTAQHQDDQAETLLLQLFRGAGAAGLASMPAISRFSAGWHLRPLLTLTRVEIEQYAQLHSLTWVNDPSNQDVHYDRNYLRQRIFPLLKQRWPGIEKTLSIAAQQQAENNDLLEQLAKIDLNEVMQPDGALSVKGLGHLSEDRQRNLLRFWVIQQQFPVPPRRILKQILQQMLSAKDDSQPCVCWSGCELHRFKGYLYVFASIVHDADKILDWLPLRPLLLTNLNQQLRMRPVTTTGLSKQILTQSLQVRFRQGGETIQPAGRQGHHSLKKLFQELEVPPWLRSRIPLIYLGNELIAVAGYCVADSYQATAGGQAYWPEVVPLSNIEQGDHGDSHAPSENEGA